MSMAVEEPECLMQQDSVCRKLDIAAALRESVSFGRFVTEPLEWGKWSSFNQNRYLEEAERYSTRGSVAEKKALFEAHYKRIAAKKAAELLEQATAAAAAAAEEEDGDGYYYDDDANGGSASTEVNDYGAGWWNSGAVVEDSHGHEGEAADEIYPVDGSTWVYGETYSDAVISGTNTIDTEMRRISESNHCGIEVDEMLEARRINSDAPCDETSRENTPTSSSWLTVDEGRDLGHRLDMDVSNSGIDTVSTDHKVFQLSDHCEIKADELNTGIDTGISSDPCRETSQLDTTTASHCLPVEEMRDPGRLDLDEFVGTHISHVAGPPEINHEASQVQQDSNKIQNYNKLQEIEQTKPKPPLFEPSPLQENLNKPKSVPDINDSSRTSLSKRLVPATTPAIPSSLTAKHQNSPVTHGKENNPTPGSSSRTKSRKRVNDKAVPLPVNYSPQHKGNKGNTTPDVSVPQKPDKAWSPKVAFGCFRSCQDLGRARGTPRKASNIKETSPKVDAGQGLHARTKTTPGKSTGQSTGKADGRWQSLTANRGNSSSCTSTPDNSQLVSSSRLDQSEDRAEKRKEYFQKLEEKLNDEKVERQLKEKEKAENELKLLRQNLCFKARPLPGFYGRTKQSKQK